MVTSLFRYLFHNAGFSDPELSLLHRQDHLIFVDVLNGSDYSARGNYAVTALEGSDQGHVFFLAPALRANQQKIKDRKKHHKYYDQRDELRARFRSRGRLRKSCHLITPSSMCFTPSYFNQKYSSKRWACPLSQGAEG
jgi:hypothetical protein